MSTTAEPKAAPCFTCGGERVFKSYPWGETGSVAWAWTCEPCEAKKAQEPAAPPEALPPPAPLAFKKADAEKTRMDLVPPRALLAVGRVLTFGARKYAPGNWRNIPADERHRYTAAAFRHLLAIMRGEALDAETGENHWAHLVCCGMFMLEFHEEGT